MTSGTKTASSLRLKIPTESSWWEEMVNLFLWFWFFIWHNVQMWWKRIEGEGRWQSWKRSLGMSAKWLLFALHTMEKEARKKSQTINFVTPKLIRHFSQKQGSKKKQLSSKLMHLYVWLVGEGSHAGKFQPIKIANHSYWLNAFLTKSKSTLTENDNIIYSLFYIMRYNRWLLHPYDYFSHENLIWFKGFAHHPGVTKNYFQKPMNRQNAWGLAVENN